ADRAWRGVAEYRAGNFGASAAAFSGREDPDGLYNLGNALAKQGKFEAAIAAWERTLELDPDDEDAAYNRDLVKRLLEEQQNAGEQGNQQSAGQQGQSAGDEGGETSEQQGQQSADGGNSQAEQDGTRQASEEA